LYCAPFRETSAMPTKIPAIRTSTTSASTCPVVPVMISLPKASTNCVAPRPRKKDQLLPTAKSTEFTSDRPAIQMNQLAPDRMSCTCLAASVATGGGPVGDGGPAVLGLSVVLMDTQGEIPWGQTVAQRRQTGLRSFASLSSSFSQPMTAIFVQYSSCIASRVNTILTPCGLVSKSTAIATL